MIFLKTIVSYYSIIEAFEYLDSVYQDIIPIHRGFKFIKSSTNQFNKTTCINNQASDPINMINFFIKI
ncbi:hypothetical protein pb186bvf_002588 [Paramecium bursaria]